VFFSISRNKSQEESNIPETLPKAHTTPINAKKFPLCLKGIKSVISASVKVKIPPAPLPWTTRPASITVIFFDTPHMIAPIVNSVSAMRRIGRRPKTCEKATKVGCQTVVARRKDVPIHSAWIAVPWRASEIVCGQLERRIPQSW